MTQTIYSLNGRIVPAAAATVSVLDRGFLYADGIFETIHAYGPALFRLDEHLRRLRRGAERLYFDPLPDSRQLRRWLTAAVRAGAYPEANLRLIVTRGSGPRGPSLAGPFKLTQVILANAYQRPGARRFREGVSAVLASFRRQESAASATLKTLNGLEQILARREADAAGADEALLLNSAGLLCEGSSSNITLVRRGALLVPDPARAGALPGIAQVTAIEAAQQLKIPVVYTALALSDLWHCEEAFLSGSMREITPLVRIADKCIGKGKPGPVTRRILSQYRRIVEGECKPFKFPRL